MQPFAPRQVTAHGVRSADGWRLKLYSIKYGAGEADLAAFGAGASLAEASLPVPAVGPGRPGVGFLIFHDGRTARYVVLGWWDRENELPIRVFVQPTPADRWRAAEGSESVCVWDLAVIAAERDSYVATVLSASGSDVEGYLSQIFHPI